MGLRLKIPRISQDVSTAQESVSRAGVVGQAMSSLGQGVQSLAGSVGKISAIQERRKKEKQKNEVARRKALYKAKLAQEMQKAKDTFQNDPDKGVEIFNKQKAKLGKQFLAGVEDSETVNILNQERQIIDITADTDMNSYRNKRNIQISIDGLDEIAEQESISLRENPKRIREAYLSLNERQADINSRDLSIEQKNKSWETASKKIVTGTINGYMKANNLRGFKRAEDFVNGLNVAEGNENQNIMNKDRYLKIINDRRNQWINNKATNDRAQKKLRDAQFQRELLPIREAVNMKIADPNADISADFNKLRRMGAISTSSNKAMTRTQMDQHKQFRSRQKLMGLLEGMSETTDKYSGRKRVYDAYFRGHLAAEDADVALNALESNLVKQYGKYQLRESDRIIKKKASTGQTVFGSDVIDPELYIRFATTRDNLVRDKGIPPITAARMIVKQQGNSTVEKDARRVLKILDPELRQPKLENVQMAKEKYAEEFIKANGDKKKIRKLEREFKKLRSYEEDLLNDVPKEFMDMMNEATGVTK